MRLGPSALGRDARSDLVSPVRLDDLFVGVSGGPAGQGGVWHGRDRGAACGSWQVGMCVGKLMRVSEHHDAPTGINFSERALVSPAGSGEAAMVSPGPLTPS